MKVVRGQSQNGMHYYINLCAKTPILGTAEGATSLKESCEAEFILIIIVPFLIVMT